MGAEINKILIVDDDANIRLITEMSLEGLTDWQILAVGSGAEAISTTENESPDLILLDMMMPAMDGVECFTKLKEKLGTSAPPVIFMTAKVQKEEVEHYKSLGAAGVITKPFDPMQLPTQIEAILGAN